MAKDIVISEDVDVPRLTLTQFTSTVIEMLKQCKE